VGGTPVGNDGFAEDHGTTTRPSLNADVASDPASRWGSEREMSEFDALLWRSERHPLVSATVVMVEILDTTPDWDRLRADHEYWSRLVRRFRQRVTEPPLGLTMPMWTDDPDFDLDYHLRRVGLATPGGMSELLSVAESIALAPFDRARPLWEARVVEGLSDGRAAYILKIHHAVTDGLGGMDLLSAIRSRSRDTTPRPVIQVPEVAAPAGPIDILLAQLLQGAEASVSGVEKLAHSLRGLFNRPRDTAREMASLAGSVRRAIGAPAAPSPLFAGRNGKAWRFRTLECQLTDLKAAGKAVGGSVNDAFVAAILGGVARYHARFDCEVEHIGTMMPISLRKESDPSGGNRLGTALIAAPLGIADPRERVAAVSAITRAARGEPALEAIGLVAPVLNRLPLGLGATVLQKMGASADLGVTNVPGQREVVYLAGARVERLFAFGPLPGAALYAALNSHVGVCCIGINFDGSAIEWPSLLMQDLQEGLDEVLALGHSTPTPTGTSETPGGAI